MNLFKVFASAKKGFQEEYASVILAWLLNPSLEHGLGFTFLCEFVGSLAALHPELGVVVPKLVSRLRTEGETALRWSLDMELFVPGAFVDVVAVLNEWVLAVENKIFPTSVQEDQLTREYAGLRRQFPAEKRIAMLYLVPVDEGGPLHPKVEAEYNGLAVQAPDFKQLVTWQANDLQVDNRGVPSIFALLKSVLAKEAACDVTPMTEYARHTLKALCRFIADDFSGYEFERPDAGTGLNPRTEEQLRVTELLTKTEGFVGVQHGVAGLLRMDGTELAAHQFQYTRSDMSGRSGWLPIQLFKDIATWLREGTLQGIEWDIKLPSMLLDRIAAAYQERVNIGVRGGRSKLADMTGEEIKKKSWRIRSSSNGSEWIDGATFHTILQSRGVGWNAPVPGTAEQNEQVDT